MKNQTNNTQLIARRTGKFMLEAAAVLTLSMLQTAAHAQTTNFVSQTGQIAFTIAVAPAQVQQANGGTITQFHLWDAWRLEDVSKRAGDVAVLPFTPLASFSDAFGDHVFFVDDVQKLEEISSPPGFALLDSRILLNSTNFGVQSAGGISGYSSNGVGAFASTVLERVFYETSDQHVHMMMSSNGGSFADKDLTLSTAGALAMKGTLLTSFHDGSGEHVFYIGADQQLYQLYGYWLSYYICNPFTRTCGTVSYVKWANQPLTAQTNSPLVNVPYTGLGPAVEAGLTSFSDASGEYVFYVGDDMHIHKLINTGAGWEEPKPDLTIAARAILPFFVTGLTSLSNALGRQVFYIGTDLDVHQIILTSSGEQDNNMTLDAKARGVDFCMDPQQLISLATTFSTPYINEVDSTVTYRGVDGHIHRLLQNNTWLAGTWFDDVSPFTPVAFNRCIQ